MEKQEEEGAQTRTYRDSLREKQMCIKVQTESKRTRCAYFDANNKSCHYAGTINGLLIISIVVKNAHIEGFTYLRQ